MNKVLSIIKNNTAGSCILEDVFESSHKLYSLKSYNLFDSYYHSFYSACKKLIGYQHCLRDLKLISFAESQNFLELVFRYQDFVLNTSRSHFY